MRVGNPVNRTGEDYRSSVFWVSLVGRVCVCSSSYTAVTPASSDPPLYRAHSAECRKHCHVYHSTPALGTAYWQFANREGKIYINKINSSPTHTYATNMRSTHPATTLFPYQLYPHSYSILNQSINARFKSTKGKGLCWIIQFWS